MSEQVARNEEVIALWNKGNSGDDIGAKLGMSRAAVIGVIHRARYNGIKVRSGRNARSQSSEKKLGRPANQPKPKMETVVRVVVPDTLRLGLEHLDCFERQPLMKAAGQIGIDYDLAEKDSCMWPTWSGPDKKGDVCGLPVQGNGIPYCNHHYRCAYRPSVK